MGQNQSNVSSSPSTIRRPVESSQSEQRSKGITVVNPRPSNQATNINKPRQLQQLDNLPRFWPILRSTLEYEHPLESFESGIKHEVLLTISSRYQQHMSTCAETVSNEQRSLTSRMKDLEMFSAGIVQQLVKRHDKINKLLPQLHRVKELSQTLVRIQKSLNECVPLVNRINMSLPEHNRLDYFSLNPNVPTTRRPPLPGSIIGTSPSVREPDQLNDSENVDDST